MEQMQRTPILLIDDNEAFANLVRDLLSSIQRGKNYELQWVDTYDAGLETLLQGNHDICLLDYVLDKEDGLSLLGKALASGCATPVVMLTGHGSQDLDIEAMRLGAVDYLDKKEISATLLERTIRHSIERKRARDALQKAHDELETRVCERTAELSRIVELLREEIAERKKVEDALRESEERFRNLMEHLPGVAIQGYHTNGTVFYWNKTSEEVYGYSAQEACGKNLGDLIIPSEIRPLFNQALGLGAQAKHSGEFMPGGEYELLRKDRSYVPVHSIHTAVCLEGREPLLFCIDVDLRERKTAEQELRRLAQAVEQAGEIIVITDTEGIIQYVNPAFEQVTGYAKEEAIGQNPRILKSGRQDQAFYEELWDTITHGRTWHGRFVNRKKDGSLYTENATISPVRDELGRTVNYVAVKRDVTRQMELEQQLMLSQRLESVGRLAGGLAHDLNNLLSPILGYADLLLSGHPIQGPTQEWLTQIRESAERAAGLTKQLLAFARKQMLETKILDLNEIVRDFQRILKTLLREDIEIDTDLEPDIWPIRGDRTQIQQILMNLSANARDAMPHGGRLTIRTANRSIGPAGTRERPGLRPGEYTMLIVQDTGEGMSPETLQHIFDPFFTTKEEHGLGLGLCTVYGIVTQHDGRIYAESEAGAGAVFEIFFPRAEGRVEAPQTDSAIPLPRGSETILIVEDEPSVLSLARDALTIHGYSVLTAGNPSEALALSDRQEGPIDLLLTDIILPQMKGNELYERLAARRPGLRVLFMSGYANDSMPDQEGKDVHFLKKPFTVLQLTRKIREALEQSATE